MAYYDTTQAERLSKYIYSLKASNQNRKILELFKNNPKTLFSPPDVQSSLDMYGTPLTSIRRAMTTLTDDKMLVRTKTKVKGLYGRDNYTWRLKTDVDEDSQETMF